MLDERRSWAIWLDLRPGFPIALARRSIWLGRLFPPSVIRWTRSMVSNRRREDV